MNSVKLVALSRSSDDALALQAILEDAQAYSQVITGGPPASDAAEALLRELPAGKDHDDKFVFGLQLDGELIGCADVVRGYPDAQTAFLGLLLLREPWQGRGLGALAYAGLESLMGDWGCVRARLAVVEANVDATAFWLALGFQLTGERCEYHQGSVESALLLMEKSVM